MTYPPQQPGPNGPQDPYGQPNSQFGQPGFGQPGPYGPFDGSHQNQFGYSGGEPPKKTGLIIGLVALGVVVVGGIVALILVLTGKDDAAPTAAGGPSTTNATGNATVTAKPTVKPTNKPTVPQTPSTPTAGKSSPEITTIAFVVAFNVGANPSIESLLCPAVPKITAQPGTTLKIAGQPQESGNTATVNLTATTGSQTSLSTITLESQAGRWCISKFANG